MQNTARKHYAARISLSIRKGMYLNVKYISLVKRKRTTNIVQLPNVPKGHRYSCLPNSLSLEYLSFRFIRLTNGPFRAKVTDSKKNRLLIHRSPPRTRRSSASSVGSCAGAMQNQQSTQLHAARSVSSNRSQSPTSKQQQQQQQQFGDEQRKINRSRSPTPQSKLMGSPGQSDFRKQRSRSPTPKPQLRSSSPTNRIELGKGGCGVDSVGRRLNEEARSPTNHGRHQEAKVGIFLCRRSWLEIFVKFVWLGCEEGSPAGNSRQSGRKRGIREAIRRRGWRCP